MKGFSKFYDLMFKRTAVAEIGTHKMQSGREDTLKNSFLNLEKMPLKRMECFRLLFDRLA